MGDGAALRRDPSLAAWRDQLAELMACRIPDVDFIRMALKEAVRARLITAQSSGEEDFGGLIQVRDGVAYLNRKAIQALVDQPTQARPIIRNLLRWAREHGAMQSISGI